MRKLKSIFLAVKVLLFCNYVVISSHPPHNSNADATSQFHKVSSTVVPPTTQHSTFDQENFLEYQKYMKEVVSVLEQDQDFKKKLLDASEEDLKSGKVADDLVFLSHHIRTQLDEVKRRELVRLRELATKYHDISEGIDREHLKINHNHIDHTNEHTFEPEDLKKLIHETSVKLHEASLKRKHEFKEHELEKEYIKQAKLHSLDPVQRKSYEEQLKRMQEQHEKHEKLHTPGSKQQLKEVWEHEDHMEGEVFNPSVFFHLHDVDGNGFWDFDEVEALMVKEVDKVYEGGHPEDDMYEALEDLERMREHLYEIVDKDDDSLISFDEFIAYTKGPEFEKDVGWETVDHTTHFTPDEYIDYVKTHHANDIHPDTHNSHLNDANQHNMHLETHNFHPESHNSHPETHNFHPETHNLHPETHNFHPETHNSEHHWEDHSYNPHDIHSDYHQEHSPNDIHSDYHQEHFNSEELHWESEGHPHEVETHHEVPNYEGHDWHHSPDEDHHNEESHSTYGLRGAEKPQHDPNLHRHQSHRPAHTNEVHHSQQYNSHNQVHQPPTHHNSHHSPQHVPSHHSPQHIPSHHSPQHVPSHHSPQHVANHNAPQHVPNHHSHSPPQVPNHQAYANSHVNQHSSSHHTVQHPPPSISQHHVPIHQPPSQANVHPNSQGQHLPPGHQNNHPNAQPVNPIHVNPPHQVPNFQPSHQANPPQQVHVNPQHPNSIHNDPHNAHTIHTTHVPHVPFHA